MLDSRNRRDDALRRLGLKLSQMVGVPQISHILKKAEGGMEQVITSLRGYDDEDAQAFVRKYDSLSSSDKGKVSLEEISIAAGVSTLDLLAAATKALFIENQTIASIIAATAHPKVVEKTVQMALKNGGVRDRETIHTAMGFLPTPKGSTFISNRIQVANFQEKSPGQEPEEPPDSADLPNMDDEITAMDSFERKMLPAPRD